MSTIKHNQYDEFGNVTGTVEIPVKPSNETETDIYITDEFLLARSKDSQPGTKTQSNYTGYEKKVWYKPEYGDVVRIQAMECTREEKGYTVIFTRLNGQKMTKYFAD